ncbi:MAG: hypothetical protein ACI841_005079 [Planctomycetota bacterium]|jgi:hypothetical protein
MTNPWPLKRVQKRKADADSERDHIREFIDAHLAGTLSDVVKHVEIVA